MMTIEDRLSGMGNHKKMKAWVVGSSHPWIKWNQPNDPVVSTYTVPECNCKVYVIHDYPELGKHMVCVKSADGCKCAECGHLTGEGTVQ